MLIRQQMPRDLLRQPLRYTVRRTIRVDGKLRDDLVETFGFCVRVCQDVGRDPFRETGWGQGWHIWSGFGIFLDQMVFAAEILVHVLEGYVPAFGSAFEDGCGCGQSLSNRRVEKGATYR